MKKKLAKLSPRKQLGLVCAGLLLFALAGYFMLVAPQSSQAAKVQAEVEATQLQLAQAQAAASRIVKPQPIRVADLFRLARAMPDQEDMPGIILELNRLAADSGISFDSITPRELTPMSGYQVSGLDLEFQGNFYSLSDFLLRLRSLVAVRGGTLDAQGRLFSVEALQFDEGASLFPQIKATLNLNAYVYGTGTTATPAAPALPSTTTTTPASAGSAPSTPPVAPTGATAAGATP